MGAWELNPTFLEWRATDFSAETYHSLTFAYKVCMAEKSELYTVLDDQQCAKLIVLSLYLYIP